MSARAGWPPIADYCVPYIGRVGQFESLPKREGRISSETKRGRAKRACELRLAHHCPPRRAAAAKLNVIARNLALRFSTHPLRAGFLAEFTVTGRRRSFAYAQDDKRRAQIESEGLGMTGPKMPAKKTKGYFTAMHTTIPEARRGA